mgnify:CR=1 FL=1
MDELRNPETVISIHALREEGDLAILLKPMQMVYFYPRPPRGGRPAAGMPDLLDRVISIHALREEGDGIWCYAPRVPTWISIHALREEGDRLNRVLLAFISDFYPRPPRGGRRLLLAEIYNAMGISIHALREEGDTGAIRSRAHTSHFYPRPPRGGRLC